MLHSPPVVMHVNYQQNCLLKEDTCEPNFLFQDDMIDDVESFVKVAAILKDRGAYKVFVMATHGILSCDASVIEDSCIDEVSRLLFSELI